MSELRVGVIGLGVGRRHATAFAGIPGVRVAAVADTNEERLAAVTDAGVRHYTRFEDLCRDREVDIVSVCLPNDLHAKAATLAFRCGKHVMCEKPLAASVEDGRRIVAAARRSGRKFMMNLHQRFTPAATHIRSLVDRGEFGDVYYSFSSYLRQPGGIPEGIGGWFYRKARSGGGALIDNGVHLIDQQWYLMGCPRPVSVAGQTWAKFGPTLVGNAFDVDDFAAGTVRFENGAMLVFENAWASLVAEATHLVRVLGTRMGATAQPFSVTRLEDRQCKTAVPENVAAESPFEHFIRCIREDRDPIVTPEQGLTMLRILEALYRSAASGRTVSIR